MGLGFMGLRVHRVQGLWGLGFKDPKGLGFKVCRVLGLGLKGFRV